MISWLPSITRAWGPRCRHCCGKGLLLQVDPRAGLLGLRLIYREVRQAGMVNWKLLETAWGAEFLVKTH